MNCAYNPLLDKIFCLSNYYSDPDSEINLSHVKFNMDYDSPALTSGVSKDQYEDHVVCLSLPENVNTENLQL